MLSYFAGAACSDQTSDGKLVITSALPILYKSGSVVLWSMGRIQVSVIFGLLTLPYALLLPDKLGRPLFGRSVGLISALLVLGEAISELSSSVSTPILARSPSGKALADM